jgi:hypothetical protein
MPQGKDVAAMAIGMLRGGIDRPTQNSMKRLAASILWMLEFTTVQRE